MIKGILLTALSTTLTLGGVSFLPNGPAIKMAAETSHKLTFKGARGTTDNISSKGIWAGGGDGTCETNFADSTASGGYCGKMTQSGTGTFKTFAWANSAGTAFTEANTYAVYFRYKTDAADPLTSMSFEWAGDWAIKGSVTDATTVWKEAYFTFTITDTSLLGNGTCLFDLGGKGTMYIDDFSCIPTVKAYTEGSALGELPAFYNAEGKEGGYWSVDGEQITSESVFSWTEDKEASVAYPTSEYSVTYRYESPIDLASKMDYWHEGGGCVSPIVTEDGETVLTRETSNLVYACFDNAETSIEMGSDYEISFDMKTSGNVYLSLQDYIDNAWKAEIFNGWHNLPSYQRQTITLNSSSIDAAGVLKLYFYFNAGDNNTITIKNLKVTKVSKQAIETGVAIGTLPVAPARAGYEFDGWYLNDQKVDASFVPTGSITLVAKYNKTKETYTVTYHKYNEAHRENLAAKHQWYKIGNASGSYSQNEEGLTIKGENSVMFRTTLDEITAGKKYHLEMKLKTGLNKVHLVINDDWVSTIKTFVQKEDLTTYSYDFIAPTTASVNYYDIQVSSVGEGSQAEINIQDFYIHEIEEYSFQEGSSLSDIPVAENGSKWVSASGEELSTSTVINGNVTAYLAPAITKASFPTSHHLDHKLMTEIEGFDYYTDKPLAIEYSWLNEKTDASGKASLTSEDVGKSLYQKIVVRDAFNRVSTSIISEQAIEILAKDVMAPKFYLGSNEFNKDGLTMKVAKNTYLYANFIAKDDIDGNLKVTIKDENGVLDCMKRLVSSGDLVFEAVDLTGNASSVTIHVVIA